MSNPQILEQTIFNQLKSFYNGGIAATLYSDEHKTSLPVHVIPMTPKPEGFAWEEFHLYQNTKIWEIETSELCGYQPKERDLIVLAFGVTYELKKTNSGPVSKSMGVFGISTQVFSTKTDRTTNGGNTAETQWGSITGNIEDQTDLMNTIETIQITVNQS